jgi:hypothetical protein
MVYLNLKSHFYNISISPGTLEVTHFLQAWLFTDLVYIEQAGFPLNSRFEGPRRIF